MFTQEDSGTAIVPVVSPPTARSPLDRVPQVAGALKPVQDALVKLYCFPEVVDRVMESDFVIDFRFRDIETIWVWYWSSCLLRLSCFTMTSQCSWLVTKTDLSGFPRRFDMGNFVLKADGRTQQRWKGERDPWIFAYYHHDWAEIGEPVLGFGPKTDQVRRNPNQKAVYGITPERVRAYMFNLLSEVSEPGDYYIDRTAKKLYFIPPKKGGSLEVSVAEMLVRGKNASFLHFEGIIFENVRGSAFSLVATTTSSWPSGTQED